MRILDVEATATELEGLVHLETQRAAAGVDLTVARVARVAGAGRIDFGGSEHEPTDREVLTPERAAPGDDYGWWELAPGSYAVRYNESLDLAPGRIGLVHPLPRLQRAGAAHPAFVADGEGPLEALLTVGSGGCALKENCRVSRLLVVETG